MSEASNDDLSTDRELWGLRLAQLFGLEVRRAGPLVARGRLRRFETGEPIATEGQPLEALHWVLEGSVEVTRGGRHYARAGAGDAVGAIAVCSRDPIGVTAIATVPTHTLAFEADRLGVSVSGRSPLLEPTLRAVTREAVALQRRSGGPSFTNRRSRQTPLDLNDPVDRMLLLRTATGGQGMTRIESLADLAAVARPIELPTGASLWRIGDPADRWALILASGKIVGRSEDREFTYGHGDMMGLLDATAQIPRWYDASVTEHVIALRLELDDLIRVVVDHPEFQDDLLHQLGVTALASWQ